MKAIQAISLFILAGLAEIGGAYLIWQWVRVSKPAFWGLLGLIALFIYGLTQTLQTFNFGRAFAAYGGVFIALATLWGWWIDGQLPDRWDWLGVGVCLIGVAIILWAPRG
ncbi:MAG: YnfA family protein [Anaerolineae bacterium]|nr:YnfA family protein [Anaerolineae bacterium]